MDRTRFIAFIEDNTPMRELLKKEIEEYFNEEKKHKIKIIEGSTVNDGQILYKERPNIDIFIVDLGINAGEESNKFFLSLSRTNIGANLSGFLGSNLFQYVRTRNVKTKLVAHTAYIMDFYPEEKAFLHSLGVIIVQKTGFSLDPLKLITVIAILLDELDELDKNT